MRVNDVLAPVIQEAQAIVNKFPTGKEAMEKGPLPHDQLVLYTTNCRVLHIAEDVMRRIDEATEIPDEEVDSVRSSVRLYASVGGGNLFDNAEYDGWLTSISENSL